ncbi:MAG TPA: hydrogenase nickel incorporation protein HypB [Sporichthyaceae bacterium]|jgi:hydrogenase nickel incorporation protein HypB|nr:hydrogenase nickel incorporation protein HypB [Sporichthyaceae bacterium]
MGRFHRHDGPDHGHGHDHAHAHDHGDLSGYATERERVMVLDRIFDENDRVARCNREDLDAAGVYAVNIMSAPGSGKTTLLHKTLLRLTDRFAIGVIEGDIETALDADRLSGLGAVVELVNTGNGFGGECHLDAPMVRSALTRLPLGELDLVVVENVGNLVCPAEFDVGAHARVMIWSVTEGEEKPLKYPVMFRHADLVLIGKIDLLPHLDVDLEAFQANLARVHPGVQTLQISARTGEGLDDWFDWIGCRVTRRT